MMRRPIERSNDLGLHDQLLRECVAMAKHALSSGKVIPAAMAATIDTATLNLEPKWQAAATDGKAPGPGAPTGAPEDASTNPQRAEPHAQDPGIRKLVAAHAALSQVVAPATPRAILLLASHATGPGIFGFLGPVSLVRRMMLAAIASLALFIGMALFPEVTGDISFVDASREKLLFNLLFLLAAAGLGASFAALFQINRYIAEANYDPKFEASYWINFALGLIAGIILAQLVPIGEMTISAGPTAPDATNGQQIGIDRLAKPTLALLGGFSSSLVNRILNRMVAAAETLVRGETRAIVAAQEQAAKARLAAQGVQSRMETISSLVAFQQQLTDGVPTESLKAKISEILTDVLDADLSTGSPADAPAETKPAKPAGTESAAPGTSQ